MLERADAEALPAWVRIGCLAWGRADAGGHAQFATGELGRSLGLSVKQTSETLAIARARGWIDPASTARCVVLPGQAHNPCEEKHR